MIKRWLQRKKAAEFRAKEAFLSRFHPVLRITFRPFTFNGPTYKDGLRVRIDPDNPNRFLSERI